MTEREIVSVHKDVKQNHHVAGVKAEFGAARGIKPIVEAILGREDANRIAICEDRHRKTMSQLGIV